MGQLGSIQSANRDVGNAPPGPFQDCRECVHIAMFFDGTGNNRFADDEAQKWSNVARLFFAAREEPAVGIYRIYLAGVGTRYNASANWADSVAAQDHYDCVCQQLRRARAHGLLGTGDLVNYVCLALAFGAQFDEVPDMAALLQRVSQREMNFDAVMKQANEAELDAAKKVPALLREHVA